MIKKNGMTTNISQEMLRDFDRVRKQVLKGMEKRGIKSIPIAPERTEWHERLKL